MIKKILEYFTKLWYSLFIKGRRVENKLRKKESGKMKHKYKALDVAKCLLYLAKSKNIEITNLKLQKLLYFCEAYYMCITDENQMFEENFNALTYGPVILKVYNKYKTWLSHPIELDDDDSCMVFEISAEENEKYKETINSVLEQFGPLKSSQLVALTHMKGSPWDEVWKKNNETSDYGTNGIIPKDKTKDWFRREFIDGN